MWIARDKDGTLNLWFNKPTRAVNFWCGQQKQDGWKATEEFIQNKHEIDGERFPELTWEDEPKEVFLNIGFDFALQINHAMAMLKCTQDELIKVREENAVLLEKLRTIKEIIEH